MKKRPNQSSDILSHSQNRPTGDSRWFRTLKYDNSDHEIKLQI